MEISKKTNKKQKNITQLESGDIEFLIDRIEKNWNPETWEDEYTEQES